MADSKSTPRRAVGAKDPDVKPEENQTQPPEATPDAASQQQEQEPQQGAASTPPGVPQPFTAEAGPEPKQVGGVSTEAYKGMSPLDQAKAMFSARGQGGGLDPSKIHPRQADGLLPGIPHGFDPDADKKEYVVLAAIMLDDEGYEYRQGDRIKLSDSLAARYAKAGRGYGTSLNDVRPLLRPVEDEDRDETAEQADEAEQTSGK